MIKFDGTKDKNDGNFYSSRGGYKPNHSSIAEKTVGDVIQTMNDKGQFTAGGIKRNRPKSTVSDVCDCCHCYINVPKAFLHLRTKGWKFFCWTCANASGIKDKKEASENKILGCIKHHEG